MRRDIYAYIIYAFDIWLNCYVRTRMSKDVALYPHGRLSLYAPRPGAQPHAEVAAESGSPSSSRL